MANWFGRHWHGSRLMVKVLSSLLKSRAALQLENIALRHQIEGLQRSAEKRLELNNSDRLL